MKENLLKYVDLKLARIFVQMSNLNNQIIEWNKNDDIKFNSEIKENKLGFKLVVSECTDETLLDHWGLLIGEIVHNLRSSLDNLAFALARLKQDPPTNPNGISFPIFQDKDKFNQSAKSKLLNHMSAEAVELIEKFQPFQRLNTEIDGEPKTDALAVLNWINIVDKHRIHTVLLLFPNKQEQIIKMEYYSAEDNKLDTPEILISGHPIKKDSVIVEYKTNYPIRKVLGNFNYHIEVCIQGPNGAESLDALIPNLYNYVATVIYHFRPLFS